MTLAAVLSAALPAWGQRALRPGQKEQHDNYHFGYVSGSIGYSMLQTGAAGLFPKGGLGGAVGLGYEFRNGGFWTSVGAQMSFHRSSLGIEEYTRDYAGADTQGKSTTLHYRVNQKDEQQWNFIDVPILFGYYTHGFHIGAGPKLSYALNPQTHSTGTYNLSATNAEYAVTFRDMPDRGYTDYTFDYTSENRLNVEVSLIGELGYDLLSSMGSRSTTCHMLKLSFYFEYGLNSLTSVWETPQPNVEPEQGNATQAVIYPMVNTFVERTRVVPFFTGVRLTYLIGGSRMARAGYHHGCMCYQ